jgi:uncharacterized protein with FMN-binding domain
MSTLSVLVLLLGYHTSTSSTMASTPTSAYRSGLEPGSPSASAGGASSGTSTGNRASSSAHAHPARTVNGDTVATQWGPVQVSLKVKGRQITEVSVPVYPSGSSTDSQINGYALPVLVRETLDQQSAQIDMVSGATVTSAGYVQSLQSALDRAGL